MAKKKATDAVTGGELVAPDAAASALAATLGYDGPLTVGALEDGIRIYQRRTVEDCLDLGKCLLLLKEITPHGEFAQRIEMLGIAERTAQRFMQAAAKISQNRHLADLSQRVKSVSAILELVTQDDDVLEDLSKMDGVDCMTASELRARVRELEAGSSDEVMTLRRREKNYEAELEIAQNKINRLSQAKQRMSQFELQTEELRAECMALQLEAELPLNALRKLFEQALLDESSSPEGRLRLEQVWVVAHNAVATGMAMLGTLQDLAVSRPDGNDLPERVMGQHTLTPQEAADWLLNKPLIENRYEAQKAMREEKRAQERPQGPGRPKGAKNKAKE